MRSEYQWLEALPPVPPTALWFASKAEELERRRSRERTPSQGYEVYTGYPGYGGYAALWPPPPLPPVSEDLRLRLEKLEAKRSDRDVTAVTASKRDFLARTVEDLKDQLRGRSSNTQRVNELEADLEASRTSERSLQAELSSSRLQEEEAKKQLQRAEADRVRLETLIVTVEQQCSDLRQELQVAKSRDLGFHDQVKELEAERDRLRSRYGESERMLLDSHREQEALRQQIAELEDSLSRLQAVKERDTSAARQLQVERSHREAAEAKVRSLTQENQRLTRSLQELEGVELNALKAKNLELEQDKRHLRKADEERRKAEASLRKEVLNLGRERQDFDRLLKEKQLEIEALKEQVATQERRPRVRHATVQPRPMSSGSSHRGTVMEVDLRVEGKPHMEEREAEDDSDEYSEEEPEHIKRRRQR